MEATCILNEIWTCLTVMSSTTLSLVHGHTLQVDVCDEWQKARNQWWAIKLFVVHSHTLNDTWMVRVLGARLLLKINAQPSVWMRSICFAYICPAVTCETFLEITARLHVPLKTLFKQHLHCSHQQKLWLIVCWTCQFHYVSMYPCEYSMSIESAQRWSALSCWDSPRGLWPGC